MKNTYFKTVLALTALVFVFACNDEDDLTGDSTANPSNPSLSVTLGFPSTQSLIETESTYDFTVTLSAPTIAAVDVKIAQTGGTATDGEDFEIPHSLRIAAGATSASGTITIFEDDLAEETENAIITIGSGFEANVSAISPQTVTFNILNYTEGDLVIDMTWTSPTDFTDSLGEAIDDEGIADLILFVTDVNIPTTNNFVTVDEEFGFESFVFEQGFPDGEYYLVAGYWSAEDFGGVAADLDISLTFNQPGVINDQVVTVPAALNTAFADCQSSIIAKLIKSGTSYTIESVGVNNAFPGIPDDGTFAGDYTVATTVAGGFGPLFDGPATIIDLGDGVRSFEGDWNGFGIPVDWEFFFAPGPCGPLVTFVDDQGTGLACAAPSITLNESSSPGTVDPSDDSSFSVIFVEDLGGCGGTPAEVEITFTKL